MAALRVEAACRVVLGQRLRGVWRLSEVTERQYHRCSSFFRQHRALAPQTHRLFVFSSVRYQSTGTSAAYQVLDAPPVPEAQFPDSTPIPEAALPPPVFEVAPTVADTIVQAEQRVSELGLGGYSPPGLIQDFLSFLHVDVGVPWWGAIVAGTLLVRIMVFPLIVKGQKEAAKLNNHMPQISALTTRMNEAKQSGNQFEFSKAYSDLQFYQKKHDVSPLRGFLVPLVQAPIFISFFVALRQMASLPVPSMQTGGLWWFSDLTIADPFYILPVVTTCTMWAVLELGAESGVDNPNLRVMKTVFRVMPLIIFPITMHFPTAVFTYWVTSNLFSIAQVTFLKIPSVREKLRIPQRIKHDPSVLPQNEGFIKSLKSGWKNAQVAQQLAERERRIKNHMDIAAKGPLRQTFSQNPLQQKVQTPVSPKKPKAKPWQDTIG
ncbi:mitochondrial inner membrane protein OXA1L [Hyperolius riggenbachi]|uniref:mitochondrial inner membrane protein OXA1L n=1 Tax=Hyperolius riggenbachi TaxID=752182 RepID=UPI0035A275EE